MSSLRACQIKAARSLLGWSQEELAKVSGISIATIRKMKAGYISPRNSTTFVVRQAMEDAGIEFMELDGVRRQPEEIQIYKGETGRKNFLSDIEKTMKRSDDPVRAVAPSWGALMSVIEDINYNLLESPKNTPIAKIILTEKKQDISTGSNGKTSVIFLRETKLVPFIVFGNKYALIEFQKNMRPKILVNQSPLLACSFRNHFDSIWDRFMVGSHREN